MKSKNIFFATCVSMVCISKILPMLVTTKQISRSIFYSSKLYKSSNIPVGTSWVMLDDKDMNVKSKRDMQEIYATIRDINVCLFAQARVIIEDNFDDWQQSGFKMTPVVESMRAIRDAMNELCKNERLYRDGIKDQKFYLLYKSSLADYSIIT